MTLPASGPIGFSDLNTETGQPSGYSASMSWINGNAKTAIAGSTGVINDMNGIYGLAYYQNNTTGNCNNGNCTSNCNCGDHNCSNCLISGTVDCSNCDAQSYLQPNCNCNCTYNCTTSQTSVNCNCNCSFICACACW
jgi:hypothetical protein